MSIELKPLPRGWRWAPLGEVLTQRNDIVHPKDGPVGSARFVGLEHIQSGTGKRLGEAFVDLAKMTGRRARFRRGDIVYGYLRPYLNKVWIAEFDGLCSVDQYVYMANHDIAETEFVAAYLRSGSYLSLAPIKETPGQLPRIRTGEVAATPIPLPGISEQRRIVAALQGRYASLRAAQALIGLESKEMETAPKAVIGSWLGEIRKAHGEQKLSDYAEGDDCFRDGPFGSNLKTAHYAKGGARVIRLQNIGDGKFLDTDCAYVSLDHYETIKRHNVRGGDVVVACLGDGVRAAGRACVIPEFGGAAVVKADCFRVRLPTTAIDPNYLVACLNSADGRKQFDSQIRGATRPRVKLSMLRNIGIPKAPLSVQRNFVARTNGVAESSDTAQRALSALEREMAALEPALLRAAFSGAL